MRLGWELKMCVFVCISHTCRNLNFAKNVTTLLHWADDMKCLINSVKNSSSKKKKKNPYLPTLFLFSPLRQYNNFLFLALLHCYLDFKLRWNMCIRLRNSKRLKKNYVYSHITLQVTFVFCKVLGCSIGSQKVVCPKGVIAMFTLLMILLLDVIFVEDFSFYRPT